MQFFVHLCLLVRYHLTYSHAMVLFSCAFGMRAYNCLLYFIPKGKVLLSIAHSEIETTQLIIYLCLYRFFKMLQLLKMRKFSCVLTLTQRPGLAVWFRVNLTSFRSIRLLCGTSNPVESDITHLYRAHRYDDIATLPGLDLVERRDWKADR